MAYKDIRRRIHILQDLYDRLVVVSKHNHRSINGEGVYAIMKHVEEQEHIILEEEVRRTKLLSKIETMNKETTGGGEGE
jgi:hypothetical protein